jgi:glutaredoxin 3
MEQAMKKVKIYVIVGCPFCERAKALLGNKKVSFDLIEAPKGSAERLEMEALTNGAKTVPQIFIDQMLIGGCDNLYALEEAGKLDELLGGLHVAN